MFFYSNTTPPQQTTNSFVANIFLLFCILFFNTSYLYAQDLAPNHNYKRIIIFGDSYSDNGNDFKLTQNQYPNSQRYFQGRFTNGPVWAEYIAQKLNIDPKNSTKFLNFAYGQASVINNVSIILNDKKKYIVLNLEGQIEQFRTVNKAFNEDDLIVVFISTNDFFESGTVKNQEDFFKKIADIETQQIDNITKLGGKNLVVFNGRNSSQTPLAPLFAKNKIKNNNPTKIEEYLENFNHLIKLYNTQLKNNLSSKKEVFQYDIYNFDNEIQIK